MLLSANKEMNYMHRLISIKNHFDNYHKKYIKGVSRQGGYRIVYLDNSKSFHVVKYASIMYYSPQRKEIKFFHVSGYTIAKYSLKKDNTLDKCLIMPEKEDSVKNFVNGLYEALDIENY